MIPLRPFSHDPDFKPFDSSSNCGLYVHVPFCISKCHYCDFFSRPCSSVPDAYIDALLNEAEFMAAGYGIEGWSTVYVGGGTPSLMSPAQIKRLMEGLKAAVPDGFLGEVTMEMNPESVSREKLEAFASGGGNRLSMGVQSLTDSALKAVGRHCTAASARKGIETVRKFWKGQLNLDAIAGLPLQSDSEFLHTLEELVSFEPDHISLYTLMVEEGTPLFDRIDRGELEHDYDEADRQWLLGRDFLESRGFMQYEVSNFARPGKESVHNMAYWLQKDYVGIGAGATGTVYGSPRGFRWTDTSDTQAYMDYWNAAGPAALQVSSGSAVKSAAGSGTIPREEELLDMDTMEFECLMMGLRTFRGVSSRIYGQRYAGTGPWNGSLEKRLGLSDGIWKELCLKGQAQVVEEEGENKVFSLTRDGLLYLNSLLTKLI